MNLQPSALAQPLQDTYNMVDIMKYHKEVKRAEEEKKRAKMDQALNKLYDTSIAVASNDYGVYSDDVMNAWNEGYKKSVEQVKAGGSLADVIPNIDKFIAESSKVKQINANVKTYANYIDGNPLLTAAEKQQAIKDHESTVFFNEDGSRRDIGDAYDLAKNYSVDVSKYYGPETMWKSFVGSQEQSMVSVPGSDGTETKKLYAWQDVDNSGNIVMKKGADGLVTDDVYAKFTDNKDRDAYLTYQAKQLLQTEYPDGIPQERLDQEKKRIATDLISAGAEQGGVTTFKPKSTGMYPPDYYASKSPVDYTNTFTTLAGIKPPPYETDENGNKVAGSKDITADFKAISKDITGAKMGSDGKIKIATKMDKAGRHPAGWVEYDNWNQAVAAVGDIDARKQLGGYNGKQEPVAETEQEAPQGIPYTDNNGGTVNIEFMTAPRGYVKYKINGEEKPAISQKDFDKLYKKK